MYSVQPINQKVKIGPTVRIYRYEKSGSGDLV